MTPFCYKKNFLILNLHPHSPKEPHRPDEEGEEDRYDNPNHHNEWE
jgi:hypothetical protein